jgi:hypothetical protein
MYIILYDPFNNETSMWHSLDFDINSLSYMYMFVNHLIKQNILKHNIKENLTNLATQNKGNQGKSTLHHSETAELSLAT